MRLNDDGKTVAAADCLVPGIGEIIGGSQREDRLELLEKRIVELGMNPDDYKYYLDLRRDSYQAQQCASPEAQVDLLAVNHQ